MNYQTRLLAFTLLLSILCFTECRKKTCDTDTPSTIAPASEISAIENYLTANSIDATQHASGLFYKITNEGSGDSPTMCSNVSVQYVGKLFNGTQFDASTSTVTFALDGLITGWQIGIPLLKKGGEAIFYIPPTLGYGSKSQGSIPANSNLLFTIKLIAFQDKN
jgi:FKBP-type peptidyl-prolyl cis-trans isomerase FkpA